MSPNRRCAAALIAGLATLAGAGSASAQIVSRLPYVQMATPDSATVAWRTEGIPLTPIVRYGLDPENLTDQVAPEQIVLRTSIDVAAPKKQPKLHSAPFETYQYEAKVTGLQPATTYYYGVFDGKTLLAGATPTHRFTTLPTPGTDVPLRLWVAGDTGEGTPTQLAGYQAMKAYVASSGRPVDAFLHLGDMAYESGQDLEFSANFFDIYEDLLRNTVCWPTMGNHEGFTSDGMTGVGPYYDAYVVPTAAEAGGQPSGTEAYYSFDIGKVHFICLDSYDLDRSPAGEMSLWLRSDLESTNAEWLIAFWHHPPYTKGTHDSDSEIELIEMREMIVPMLESAGVDLVLTGHSHIYERSMLIDGAYATPTVIEGVVLDDGDGDPAGDGAYRKSANLNPNEGTVAVVAGNGDGAGSFYGFSPVMRKTIGEVGSVILDIDGDTLTGRMINSNAEVRDVFQLVKSGIVEQQVVEYPWQPFPPTFLLERFEPGATFVEMAPSSTAPDAQVYFTTDGTAPDSAATAYSAPIPVPDNGSSGIQAVTTWNGGSRTGPIGSPPQLAAELSLYRFPAAAEDDAYEDALGTVSALGETILIGGDGITALRYDDVRIPIDAYLVRADIQFYKASDITEFGATSGTVYAERHADSPPITEAPGDLSGREPTASAIPWTVRTWSPFRRRDLNTLTPDLRPILSEIMAVPGWQSGNAITFLFQQTGEGRTAGAFDGGKDQAASLNVVYIDADGIAERLASNAVQLARGPNGLFGFFWIWPLPDAAANLGVNYQIEASADLENWFPAAPISDRIYQVFRDGFVVRFAEYIPAQLGADGDFYFRLKVIQQ